MKVPALPTGCTPRSCPRHRGQLMQTPVLYDYWRSSASYRVRIALNLVRDESRRLADQVRIFSMQVAADGKNGPGLDRWAAAWERLSRWPGEADTLPAIIQEMLLTTSSERQGRVIDHDQSASMEKKKQEGYF